MKKQILKIAYKMPPQENWNRFRDKNQSNPNFITEKHYKMVVDAGFTHGLGLLEHGEDVALRALETAQKVGLKYYVRDAVNWANILHPDYYYYNKSAYEKYQKFSSYAGLYVYDEPNANKFSDLAKMVDGYGKFFKGVGEPLVNLLPTYANCVEQLGADSYEEYINRFAKEVPTDYIMFDHYPIRVKDRVEEYLLNDYLYNCRVVANACKNYGKDYRAFVQASVMDRGNTDFPSQMLDFQVHVHLAHGAKALVYYYYWGDEELNGYNGLCDWNGNPTPLYYGVKKIHTQIETYENELLHCKWNTVYCVKGDKNHHNKEEFDRLGTNEKSLFKGEYDLLIGEFDCKKGKAYYLVNYVYPRLNLSNEVVFTLDKECAAYVNGEKLLLKKGKNRMKLNCGGGVFIVPN